MAGRGRVVRPADGRGCRVRVRGDGLSEPSMCLICSVVFVWATAVYLYSCTVCTMCRSAVGLGEKSSDKIYLPIKIYFKCTDIAYELFRGGLLVVYEVVSSQLHCSSFPNGLL